MGKGYESQILFQVTFPLERLKLPKQCHQQGTSIQIPDSIWAVFHSKNISVTLCLLPGQYEISLATLKYSPNNKQSKKSAMLLHTDKYGF